MEVSSFEQVLEEYGQLIYTNVGDSMYPLIQPGDLLVINQTKNPLKRLDIPLYKRDNGQYVLHRIVKVRKNDYLLCGDNRYGVESGITDRHIIGVLVALLRRNKEISVYSFRYRLYAHLWCDFFFFRRAILYCKHRIKRRKKRV